MDGEELNRQESGGEAGGADPIFSTILAECPELWDVVNQFARGLPGQIEELEQACQTAAYEQILDMARAMVTAGRGNGFPELAAYAAALERSARDHMLDSIESRVQDLRELARQIEAGLTARAPDDPKQ